jgi:hypothetical protein
MSMAERQVMVYDVPRHCLIRGIQPVWQMEERKRKRRTEARRRSLGTFEIVCGEVEIQEFKFVLRVRSALG